jgi:hypothetical protein
VSGAAEAAWLRRVGELVGTAPPWMRSRAAPELFVGGFTQAWLEVPVLSLTELAESEAGRVVVFFLAACLARGVGIARVECPDRSRTGHLIAHVEQTFAGALRSLDGENAALMGYFDAYLEPPGDVREQAGDRIAARLAEALRS